MITGVHDLEPATQDGALFLDEIGKLSLPLQALSTLQEQVIEPAGSSRLFRARQKPRNGL